jgi:hypothetical protein
MVRKTTAGDAGSKHNDTCNQPCARASQEKKRKQAEYMRQMSLFDFATTIRGSQNERKEKQAKARGEAQDYARLRRSMRTPPSACPLGGRGWSPCLEDHDGTGDGEGQHTGAVAVQRDGGVGRGAVARVVGGAGRVAAGGGAGAGRGRLGRALGGGAAGALGRGLGAALGGGGHGRVVRDGQGGQRRGRRRAGLGARARGRAGGDRVRLDGEVGAVVGLLLVVVVDDLERVVHVADQVRGRGPGVLAVVLGAGCARRVSMQILDGGWRANAPCGEDTYKRW